MKTISDFDKVLGKKIEYYRILRGFSRKTMAEKLKITQQQVQKYEKGVNRITVSRLNDICKILGVSISEITVSKPKKLTKTNKIIIEIMELINSIKDSSKLYSIRNLVRAFVVKA
jgi:transcriptional regulator with XRE-family HTH domain